MQEAMAMQADSVTADRLNFGLDPGVGHGD